jgi:hypothetical protein
MSIADAAGSNTPSPPRLPDNKPSPGWTNWGPVIADDDYLIFTVNVSGVKHTYFGAFRKADGILVGLHWVSDAFDGDVNKSFWASDFDGKGQTANFSLSR